MKIAIDIDDTLTNTKQQQIKLWKKYYNNNPHKDYSEKLPQNINEWGDKYIEDFWDTYRELLSFNSSYKDIKYIQPNEMKLTMKPNKNG